jgi:NTE family protein
VHNIFVLETRAPTRAVILGGGGVTGIAWEIGVVAGLRDAGVDLGVADALFGTSAGAFAAALIASAQDIERKYAAQFEPDPTEVPAHISPEVMEKYSAAVSANYGQAIPLAKAYSDIARTTETIGSEVRLGVVRARLGIASWPNDRLHFTAIDADTGELVVLDSSSGLTVTEAAAATGAVPGIWPMVSAGGRNWIDGGMISAANVHLGERFDRVIVIAPSATSMNGFDDVETAAAKLRGTSDVVVIIPDAQTLDAIGPNVFDPTRRGAAAEAGRRQASAAAADVIRHWIGGAVTR